MAGARHDMVEAVLLRLLYDRGCNFAAAQFHFGDLLCAVLLRE
jgi:hypothetical protein